IIFVRKSLPATSAATAIVAAAPRATRSTGTATGTRSACFLRTGFVDFQIAPADLLAIEGRDRFCRLFVVGHFHKAEAARPPGLAIHGHMHASELAEWLEERTQVCRCGLEAHVAHKQVLHALCLLTECNIGGHI